MLSECLNNGNGSSYASKVIGYLSDHAAQRSDAITSLFLTNHDQDRWAEWVGKDATKQKQAAAMLLTSGGKPFIYMGEELGYYGTKSSGDEGVRQPMSWDRSLSDLCRYGLDDAGKSDAKMNKTLVSASNSVKAQEEDANSLLNVYKAWSRLRNTYPSLAAGTMSAHSTLTSSNTGAQSIAAWYMTSGTEKMLVIHNLGGTDKSVTISDDLTHPVALLGTASVTGKSLKLGAHSSVVFQLQ
jgi:glycosidase